MRRLGPYPQCFIDGQMVHVVGRNRSHIKDLGWHLNRDQRSSHVVASQAGSALDRQMIGLAFLNVDQ